MLRRSAKYLNGTWQMVFGEIRSGEKTYEAALRQVQEQTGLIPDRLYNADAVKTLYMPQMDKVFLVPVFIAFIDQQNTQIRLSTEHDSYDWVAYDVCLDRLVFAEQKRVLAHIHTHFVLNDPNPLHLIKKISN